MTHVSPDDQTDALPSLLGDDAAPSAPEPSEHEPSENEDAASIARSTTRVEARKSEVSTDVIQVWLDTVAAFQVCSVDGREWLCPYTARRVAIQDDWRTTASTYLQQSRPWRHGSLRTAVVMRALRWYYYLYDQMAIEPRLRYFLRDGRWINPFAGTIVQDVRCDGGYVTERSMMSMARVLGACPHAAKGLLRSDGELRAIMRNAPDPLTERTARVAPTRQPSAFVAADQAAEQTGTATHRRTRRSTTGRFYADEPSTSIATTHLHFPFKVGSEPPRTETRGLPSTTTIRRAIPDAARGPHTDQFPVAAPATGRYVPPKSQSIPFPAAQEASGSASAPAASGHASSASDIPLARPVGSSPMIKPEPPAIVPPAVEPVPDVDEDGDWFSTSRIPGATGEGDRPDAGLGTRGSSKPRGITRPTSQLADARPARAQPSVSTDEPEVTDLDDAEIVESPGARQPGTTVGTPAVGGPQSPLTPNQTPRVAQPHERRRNARLDGTPPVPLPGDGPDFEPHSVGEDKTEVLTQLSPAQARRRSDREGRTLSQEVELAGAMQRELMRGPPDVKAFTFATRYMSCVEVSGDFFQFIEQDNGDVGFAQGDVSGHGVQAGLLMSMARQSLAILARNNTAPRDVVCLVNDILTQDLRGRNFITLSYALLQPSTRTLRFVRAGHPPAMLFRAATRTVEVYSPKGMLTGVVRGKSFSDAIEQQTVVMDPQDVFLFFTDGVIEAHNPQGDEFGIERLEAVVGACDGDPEALCEAVIEAVMTHTRRTPLNDDLTLLALGCN